MFHDRRMWRVLLGIAFVFRLLFALRFSYLHPDEHLQGPQEIAHGVFGWAAQTPWEFTSDAPLRSFVPMWIIYGIPMSFFNKDTDPIYVLYTLRAVFAILTWILEDSAVDRLAPTRNDKLRTLFFVSTSYVTLTWQSHTLSNALETILVLWYLVILHETESTAATFQSSFDRHYDSALLGFILVIGLFNRPTFLVFLLLPSLSLLKFWYRFPATLFTFAAGVAIMSALCIQIDTLLYGKQDGYVITPLNFLKYNMYSSSLEEHGLHSRFTHLVASLPQLLGPGLLLLRPRWRSHPMQSVIGALILLSLIPHQEARFLLPLIPLLCTQMDLEQFSSVNVSTALLSLWLAFNVVLGVFMGVFHQGGVIPAQSHIRTLDLPQTVVWWKTYTPPLWVTGLPSKEVDYIELSPYGEDLDGVFEFLNADSGKDLLRVVDLQGASVETLDKVLDKLPNNALLVAPFSRTGEVGHKSLKQASPVWKTRWHYDPDQIQLSNPGTWSPGLGIWQL